MESKLSVEAVERKSRSESILRAELVPLNKHLPVIETESDSIRRSAQDIAYRALALIVVAVKGEGLEQEVVERIVQEYGLQAHFTPKELRFIRDVLLSNIDRVQFAWRYEAAWVMLWALGYVERLGKPTAICDVSRAVRTMKDRNTSKFIKDSSLRPLNDLLDQADLIYRYHWAVVDARVNSRPAPANLEPGVTLERHYALNWLVGYMGQEWDHISTDT